MNFLNILKSKKADPKQVAQEIAILENRLPGLKVELDAAEKDFRRLRQTKLAGQKVDQKEYEKVLLKKDETKADFGIIQETIEELHTKLIEAVDLSRIDEITQLFKEQAKLQAEKPGRREKIFEKVTELLKLFAELQSHEPIELSSFRHIYFSGQENELLGREIQAFKDNFQGKMFWVLEHETAYRLKQLEENEDGIADLLLNEARAKFTVE